VRGWDLVYLYLDTFFRVNLDRTLVVKVSDECLSLIGEEVVESTYLTYLSRGLLGEYNGIKNVEVRSAHPVGGLNFEVLDRLDLVRRGHLIQPECELESLCRSFKFSDAAAHSLDHCPWIARFHSFSGSGSLKMSHFVRVQIEKGFTRASDIKSFYAQALSDLLKVPADSIGVLLVGRFGIDANFTSASSTINESVLLSVDREASTKLTQIDNFDILPIDIDEMSYDEWFTILFNILVYYYMFYCDS
jgi:hypothetical protein